MLRHSGRDAKLSTGGVRSRWLLLICGIVVALSCGASRNEANKTAKPRAAPPSNKTTDQAVAGNPQKPQPAEAALAKLLERLTESFPSKDESVGTYLGKKSSEFVASASFWTLVIVAVSIFGVFREEIHGLLTSLRGFKVGGIELILASIEEIKPELGQLGEELDMPPDAGWVQNLASLETFRNSWCG